MLSHLTALPRVSSVEESLDRCVSSETLVATRDVRWISWHCQHDGPSLRAERHHDSHVLKIVGRGACAVSDGNWSTTLDPATAVLHRPGSSYRTTHPFGLIDSGWSIAYGDVLAEEVLGRGGIREEHWRRPELTTGARPLVPLLYSMSLGGLGRADGLDLEEAAIELLAEVARGISAAPTAPTSRAADSHRRLVRRTTEFLNSHLLDRVPLATICRAVGSSPAHLCRIFRAQTGMSIRAYRRRLRLAKAIELAAEHRGNLSRAALEAGFSSHSHLSSTCSELTGRTLSDLLDP